MCAMEVRRARVKIDGEMNARYLAFEREPDVGARLPDGDGGREGAVEAIVDVKVERCDAGRCAVCRDNARTRFVVKQSDAHGVKKWCDACVRERLAVDPRSVEGAA